MNEAVPTTPSVGRVDSRLNGLDLGALTDYLGTVVGPLRGPLRADLIAGGRSNPTYRLSDGIGEWVLRRPPYGAHVMSGHDMSREVTAMSALVDSAVPIPHIVAFCEREDVLGAPFYVMDRLDGRTYRTQADTARLSEGEREALSGALVTTLVDLHAVDPAAVGLRGWGRPEGYLERQVSRWGRQWDAVATEERPEVHALLGRLAASLPHTRAPGIVHGDYKIDNVMVAPDDPGRVLGVLDWEMSTLGDTMADLGLLISFWDEPGGLHNPITQGATALAGFWTVDDVVEGYVRLSGRAVDDLDWYIVFSDLKIAVILEQIHRRHLEGNTIGDGFDDIGAMVGPLIERARDRAARSSVPALRGATPSRTDISRVTR